MRVAFTGKGGSGKTTISSLFARSMATKGHAVLALDADINQHLAEALEVHAPLRSMGEEYTAIKAHLAGTNTRVTAATMHKTTPPGTGSNLVRVQSDDWFISTFAQTTESGAWVAGAGEIPEGNVGVKCYHGLNGAVELVLGHMLDTPEDVVVVDMTAGADAFSSSLFTKVDALLLVVEPTLKSLAVYDQFKPHADSHGIPLLVVGNKVESADDRQFIESRVGKLVACLGPSTYIKQRERGMDVAFDSLEDSITDELSKIYAAIKALGRDWQEMERRSYDMHRRNAESWMGADALDHIDPSFSLAGAAKDVV